MHLLWTDTETTGLDAKVNSLWQLGTVLYKDDQVVAEFEETMCPPKECAITDQALAIGGITRADLASFGTQDELYTKFMDWILPFKNKIGKLTIAGWNVGFDKPFIEQFFSRVAGGTAFSQLFYHYTVDPYALARILQIEDAFKCRYGDRPINLKLGALAQWLKIDTSKCKMHSALSDAHLAKQVYTKLKTDFLYTIKQLRMPEASYPPEILPEKGI